MVTKVAQFAGTVMVVVGELQPVCQLDALLLQAFAKRLGIAEAAECGGTPKGQVGQWMAFADGVRDPCSRLEVHLEDGRVRIPLTNALFDGPRQIGEVAARDQDQTRAG